VKKESTKKQELFDAKLVLSNIKNGKIKVEKVTMKPFARKIKKDFNLGEGEVESIVLYKEGKGKLLATDDGPTIKACKILGVPVVTAPDFLVRACKKGKISREIALEKLNKLEKYGRYSPRIIEDVKRKIKGD
jgi:predicted nucleic acid-binding protein